MHSPKRDAYDAENAEHFGEANREVRTTPRDLRWGVALMLLSAVVLWRTWSLVRPLEVSTPQTTAQRASCLSNLQQIARGFALYASDWDGKFPRGKDAEDRNSPQIWQRARIDGKAFYMAVKNEPMLPDLLQPYQVPSTAWHCPADVGWDMLRSSTNGPQSLRNVHPSAWQKYGMSYSYLTEFGLRGLRASGIGERVNKTLLLFDGDFWHRESEGGQRRAGALFADGQARMITPAELDVLMSGNLPFAG